MNDRDIDQRLGELLSAGAPIPEHGEGYRERLATLLAGEEATWALRTRRWFARARSTSRTVEAAPVVVREVSPRPTRSRRPALVATLAFLLLVFVFVGVLEPLQHLLSPTMVLRITDETIVDVDNPAATRTTVVATSLVSLDETRDLIHDLIDAINANDISALGNLYATNGWVENDVGKASIQGSVGIVNYWRNAHDQLGLRVETAGDPIPYDRYIAQPIRYSLPNEGEPSTGVFVFQIDTNGQIAHHWIMGWVGQ